MSRYPYFIETLDERWNVVLKSLRSDNPDVGFVVILLNDLAGAQQSMKASYNEPNRDAAIAELEGMTGKFRAELSTKVDLRFGTVSLLPGATAEEVGVIVEKFHKVYLKFRENVKLE